MKIEVSGAVLKGTANENQIAEAISSSDGLGDSYIILSQEENTFKLLVEVKKIFI